MKSPLVSIITPCYNVEDYIGRYLDSILAQTYANLELILVDDGSDDATAQIIEAYRKKFAKRQIAFTYIYQEHVNQAAAINRGLAVFRGDYLIWPDADDILEASSIAAKVAFLEARGEYGLVRTDFYYIDAVSRRRRDETGYRNNDEPDLFVKLMTGETYCICGCYMVRAKAFLSLYPERRIEPAEVGQNFQMLLPAAYFFPCGYIAEKLYGVVLHNDSHSRRLRTPEQKLARIIGFEQLLDKIYALCGIRDKKLLRVKEVRNAMARMTYALSVHKRFLAVKQLAVILLNRGLDRRLLKRIINLPLSRLNQILKKYLIFGRPEAYRTYMMNSSVSQGDRVIYLTFDSGWIEQYTPAILDILQSFSAHAAFFLMGTFIRAADPALLTRMKEDGHLIGNHSLTHPDFTQISSRQVEAEILGCNAAFYEKTGFPLDPYMRPPSGSYNRRVLRVAKRLGCKTILWSMAYGDFDMRHQPGKQFVLNYFKEKHHNGAVVLIHTISQSSTAALPEVLAYLKKEGYRFGSLAEFAK